MRSEFGPWTTHIGPSPVEGLSGFWTRRILRLPDLTACPTSPSRRQILQLGALGLGLAAMPTLRPGVAQEAVKPTKPGGTIFLVATFREGEQGVPYIPQLVSIDARSGERRIVGPMESGIMFISRDGKRVSSNDSEVKDGNIFYRNIWIREIRAIGKMTRPICEFGEAAIWSGDDSELIVPLPISPLGKAPRLYEYWRMNVDGSQGKKLAIPERHYVMDWSRDGQWIATTSSDHSNARGLHVYLMHPDGSGQRRISTEDLSAFPKFSPDSRRVVFAERGVLVSFALDGNDRRVLFRPQGKISLQHSDWSPDGTHIACVVCDRDPVRQTNLFDNYRILVFPSEGGEPRTIQVKDSIFLGQIYWR